MRYLLHLLKRFDRHLTRDYDAYCGHLWGTKKDVR